MVDVVDPQSLGDLPPDRFGEVVAAIIADVWDEVVDVAPPTPAGTVEAVVGEAGERRLLHVRQVPRVDVETVRDVATIAADRGFESATLATTGIVPADASEAAEQAGISIVDGEAIAGLAGAAGVELEGSDDLTAASLATQFAGRWPASLRERAVEAAEVVDGVADFDYDDTRASGLTDVDLVHADAGGPVVRLRFTSTSFLVYVRGAEEMEVVVRLSEYRDHQPPLPADLAEHVERSLDGPAE